MTGASPVPSVMPALPGEEWIAYEEFGIRLVRPDGTDEHLIAPEYHPTFTPDGKRIIFVRARRDATHGRWPDAAFIDTDGSHLRIVSGPSPWHPRLRPTPPVP